MAPDPDPRETRLLEGRLSLLQPNQGYRFAMDPLVLAGFCRLEPGWSVLEPGAGNGVLSLLLAHRFPETRFTLVEIQESLADLARANISRNNLGDRLELVRGDLREKDLFPEKSFQALAINPPYLALGSGRLGPDRERNLARHELACTLEDWTRAGARWLADQGLLFAVYPVLRLDELLAALARAGLIPKRLRLVHENPQGKGILALVEARLGGRPGLSVEPPLFADLVDKESIPL